jgi:hypothetical protein
MYKFKKIDGDKFTLIYEKEKEKKQIEFTRTVKSASRLQSIDSEARFRVMKELTEKGYTMDNNPFIIEKTEGNKTIRDESNLNYLIEKEKETTTAIIISEIVEETFGISFDNLIPEIGENPQDEKAVFDFIQKFLFILRNGETEDTVKTPSSNN